MEKVFLFWFIWGVSFYASALKLDEACTTPDSQSGTCILVKNCPYIQKKLSDVVTPDGRAYIQNCRCGQENGKALVCCPTPRNATSLLPDAPDCGQDMANRIFGGVQTDLDEYPWLALIQYNKGIKGFAFHCGASLINPNYVLTAAHCIKAVPASWKPHLIRLGEWDTQSQNDCNEDGHCSLPAQDITIQSITVHEEYRSDSKLQLHDIALIRLSRSVEYSSYINPICLPKSAAMQRQAFDNQRFFTAGWGRTETQSNSRYKLKVGLDFYELGACNKVYKAANIVLKESQICAGGVIGEDSCSGDSGGPLMKRENPFWYMVGIVSFGPRICGTENTPGVYTKVASYIDWIESKLQP